MRSSKYGFEEREVTGTPFAPHTNIIINQIAHVCDNVVSNLQDDVAIFPIPPAIEAAILAPI
jgi:hypothetical protein